MHVRNILKRYIVYGYALQVRVHFTKWFYLLVGGNFCVDGSELSCCVYTALQLQEYYGVCHVIGIADAAACKPLSKLIDGIEDGVIYKFCLH